MKRLITTSLLFSVVSITTAQKATRPNIIIFLVDDMGLMDTSVPFLTDESGVPIKHPLNERYRTPNMEALAQQGVRFSRFYTQSVSSPSRASIITGQNSTRHGITTWILPTQRNIAPYDPTDWNWEGLDGSSITIPRLLQEHGYRTIHIGKAHFGPIGTEGEDPCNIGFDVNIAGCAIGHPGSYLAQNNYDTKRKDGQTTPSTQAVPGLEKYHGSDLFLTEALTREALTQIERAVTEQQPFFLHMSHYAVHSPFEMDKRFEENYDDIDINMQEKRFATLIEGMDSSLGDIVDKVNELGIGEDTFIIFLGDNGSDAPVKTKESEGLPQEQANPINIFGHASSAPLRAKKATEWEGGVRTAFIASWVEPNQCNKNQCRLPIASGEIQLQRATVMDIFPTILSLAQVHNPKEHIIDGFDLKVQMNNKENKERSEEILMHFPHKHRTSYFTTFINGDWKFIYYYNPESPEAPSCKLFNLKDDPYENNDVAKENEGIRRMMNKRMIEKLEQEGALYPICADGRQVKPIIL